MTDETFAPGAGDPRKSGALGVPLDADGPDLPRTTPVRARPAHAEALEVASQMARVGGWIVELPWGQLTWSDEVAAIHDLPPGTTPPLEQAFALYAPKGRVAIEKAFGDCARDGTAFDLELQIVTALGHPRWVRVMGRAVFADGRPGPGARVTRVQGAFQDISDRKAIEENLRLSEERFKYVSRATTDAVWDWDLRTDAMWWNEGLHNLFGVVPGEVAPDSTSWVWRIHPADHQRVLDSTFDVINGNGTNWSAEYRFRRQDGSYAEVFDRGFVIRDEHGKALRMVGGMTDLSEQRLAEEEALLDAETRASIAKIQQEIAALDLTLDLEAVMTLTAERARMLTGASGGVIELLEGTTLVCRASAGETPGQNGTRLQLHDSLSGLALQSGEVLICHDVATDPRVNRAMSLSSSARSVIAAPLRSGSEMIGVLKMLSDAPQAFTERDVVNMQILVGSLGSIIQRHRIAEQLRQSETQYRLLFNNNPMPMWVYEAGDWRFLAVNQAAVDHYGYTEAEFLSMRLRDIWPPDDVAAFEQLTAAVLHNRPQYAVKRRHRKKNGEFIDVESSGNGIVFDGQSARLAMANDVTHRLRAEHELASVSRAQRMLSACNESLIRATSEDDLLQEICRITVDIGGYRMAWVGYAQDDDEKSVRIAAHWGEATDYLRNLPLSWSPDVVIGQGPVGRTIRSGRMVIVDDIALDVSFAPWVQRALASGFHGVVCLPLRATDGTTDANGERRTFGLFYLYAPQVLHVSADEIRLLEELANDLAFGIGNLRAQAEQRRLQAAVLKVAVAVSTGAGSTFFEHLARNMAEALGAQVGLIARLLPTEPPGLRLLSAVVDGEALPPFDRPLAGTRCEDLSQVQWLETDIPARRPAADHPLANFPARAHAGRRLDNSAGQPIGVIAVMFDAPLARPDFVVSTLQIFAARAAAEIERQEADARILDQASLLDKAQDAIIVRALDHRVLYWNKSAERLYGWTSEEALGQALADRTHMDFNAFLLAHAELIARGEWSGEINQVRKDGSALSVEARWTLVRDATGEPVSVLAINTDITDRKAAEREIQKLAFYDTLTQLPNRLLLMDRLQHALAASTRSGRGGALLFIDLDNFKTLNDTLGHDQGDLLLQQVALRLTACVREADSVARLGGDEFVVMLEELGQTAGEIATQAKLVGEKVLAMLGTPYRLAHGEHQSTASIGIAPFSDHQDSMGELLKQADIAMYQAKAAGRNTLRFFDPGLQAAVTARASLETDMRTALAQDEFTLHYQPQSDRNGHISGVEALIRWSHPQRGPVSPAAFIPLAEETGIILQIGQKVLHIACTLLATWALRPETAQLTMAVNVSSRQFRHPDFVGHVTEVLQRTGADPYRLKLELTESLMVDDMDVTVEKMTELQRQGVGFSLDDFGTGYSSLSYLKRLPLDQLKIDQSFVRDVLTDANDSAIARTIIALGQSLGLNVIAEGVETEAQRDFLSSHGCHAYQGYLYSRPLTEAALAAFIREKSPLPA